MAEVGSAGVEVVDVVQVDLNAALVGDGREMEHGVGGAAQGHIHDLCIVEGGLGHNVTGPNVLFQQLHHLHTCLLGQPDAGGVGGGNGAVAPETHADGFRQAVHGVCGIHTGTGAAGGAAVHDILLHALFVQRPGMVSAYCLEHIAQAGAPSVVQVTGQHGAAGDKNGRDVDTGGGHQEAGDILVAVGDHDQRVKLVGNGHALGGVGNQVTGDQRIPHADMAHGNTVTDGNGGKFNGRAAGHTNAGLDRLGDLVQIHMSGDDLVMGTDNTHQRAVRLLLGIAQSGKQGAVGGPLHALGHVIRTHGIVPPWRRG